MKNRNKLISCVLLSCMTFSIISGIYVLKSPIQIEKRIEQHWVNSNKPIESLTGQISYKCDDEIVTYDCEYVDNNVDYETMETYGTYSVWKTKQKKNVKSAISTQYTGLIDRERGMVYATTPKEQAYKHVSDYFVWNRFVPWYQYTDYKTQNHFQNLCVGALPPDEITSFLKQSLFHDDIVIVQNSGRLEFGFQPITCKLKNLSLNVPDFQVITENKTKTIHDFTFKVNAEPLPSDNFFEKPKDLSSYPIESLPSINDHVMRSLSKDAVCLVRDDYKCGFAKHSLYDSHTISNDVLYVKPVSETSPEITIRFMNGVDIKEDLLLDKKRSLDWYQQQDGLSDFFISDLKQVNFFDKNTYSYCRQYTDVVHKFVSKEFVYMLPVTEKLCVQMVVSQVSALGDTELLMESQANDLLSYLIINKDGDE